LRTARDLRNVKILLGLEPQEPLASQGAIPAGLFRAPPTIWICRDLTGNLPPLPDIFLDDMAPVVRIGADGEREPRDAD
jgi:hypothetical protein